MALWGLLYPLSVYFDAVILPIWVSHKLCLTSQDVWVLQAEHNQEIVPCSLLRLAPLIASALQFDVRRGAHR